MKLDGRVQNLEDLPSFHSHTRQLAETFLLFQQQKQSDAVTALPSKQTLLLEPHLAGKVFVNGRYMTTWGGGGGGDGGADHGGGIVTGLFGMDLHSIPIWHGRIVDYELLKKEYSNMWQEILIDARLMPLNLGGMLLFRLMYGTKEDDDEDDGYDDDDEEDASSPKVDTSQETLESQVMAHAKYDPVGICAKALATKFAHEFGRNAFPVESSDVAVAKHFLGHRTPVVVPARVIQILRRGGYFDWKRTMEEVWFTENVRPSSSSSSSQSIQEQQLVEQAIQCLEQACKKTDSYYLVADILPSHILWVHLVDTTSGGRLVDADPIKHRNLCRYHEGMRQFYVNDVVLNHNTTQKSSTMNSSVYLGWILAQEHPDGTVRERYFQYHLLKNNNNTNNDSNK